MRKKKRTIRFDERTWMILNEVSKITGSSLSVIIRGLVMKGIDELTDEAGNLNINEKQIQKK